MASSEARRDFPDEKQRAAFCYSRYRERKQSMENLVPYYEQWIGPWAMLPDALNQTLELFRKIDLHLHLQQQQEIQQAARSTRGENAGQVAVIELTGKLMKQQASMGGGTSTVQARRDIRTAANDPDVSAILLKIDSPGGTAAGTEELAQEVAAAKAKKPVWAYVEDLAASAAYWVASQTSHIVANATGLVGSIGTYGVVQDMSGAAAMEGVKVHVVRAGEMKGVGTPGTEITTDHLADMQRIVNDLNEHFLAGVTSGRENLTAKQVRELADGRVYIADEAKKLGLIDAVGSFDQALSDLQKLASKRRPIMQASLTDVTAVDAALAVDVTAQHQQAAPPLPPKGPQPASYQEIVAGCIGADPSFICAQQAAGATLSQAQAAWMAEQNKRIVAAQQKPGVDAVGTRAPGKQQAASAGYDPDAIASWNQLVAQKRVEGMDQRRATSWCVENHPQEHAAYLAAFNAEHPQHTR